MSIGFEIIYPDNCKEVHEGLKIEELKRRLGELKVALQSMSEVCNKVQDSLLNVTEIDDNGDQTSLSTPIDLRGLFLHLSNEQFIDHGDREVQLRVAVCLCHIIKITCPNNPFSCYTDDESITKSVLHFLLKCIKELARIKTRDDRLFFSVYTVLSICCEIDIFHFYATVTGGIELLSECIRVFFDVLKRSSDWCEDAMASRMVTDTIINLLNSSEVTVSESLVSYLLNMLVDRCSSKLQKQASLEIFSKCSNKLEEQIQSVLQSLLIKSDKEEDLSDSSDNDDLNNDDDDFCSLDSYKLKLKRSEKIKPKLNKVDVCKGVIESSFEYACHHVFQMIFEIFKINETIITPLLSTIEMKLKSTNVTDRKRACRFIGKLFSSSHSNDNPNQCFLWETFLGRFSDIELEVREICIKIARDLLKNYLEKPDNCGILILDKEKEDLIKAFQKRSNDQEESIRYLVVLAVSQILEQSKTIIQEELDSISEAMFKLLLHQSRDKFLSVRKEAHAMMGKLYRRMIVNIEMKSSDKSDIDLSLGLRNLSVGQKSRIELLLNLILRPYLSLEVEDRILVERLFNTSLVPYGQDSSARMKSLLQCLTLTDESSMLCIHEMLKTQITVMNVLRQTMHLIGEVSSDRVMSSTLSQKLREKVKKLAEFLSSKDKVDSLTKLFNQVRSDKKLNELLQRFVNKDSTRQVIVKTIMDIRKYLTSPGHKTIAVDMSSSVATKRKLFVTTVRCILERGAPILFDSESVQELLSHCVATKEAMEFSSNYDANVVPLSRTLKLMHTLILMSRKMVPLHEVYEYIVSLITADHESTLDNSEDDTLIRDVSKEYNFRTHKEEELCLLVLCKITELPRSIERDVEGSDVTRVDTILSSCSAEVLELTRRIISYLEKRCLLGSAHKITVDNKIISATKKEQRQEHSSGLQDICQWKYDCKVAKLASHCFVGILLCCQYEADVCTEEDKPRITVLITETTSILNSIVSKCCQCKSYSDDQPMLITSLTYIAVKLTQSYDNDIRTYATDVVPKLLADDVVVQPESQSRNLSLWQKDCEVSKKTQVKIQALKLLSRWVVTLKADESSDQKCIVYVMSSLRKYIGSYGMEDYSGDVSDTEMSCLRLSAGKCWLRIAQVQSFLHIFDVKWIYKLSCLIYDPCQQVREEFLQKLHSGLYKLKLPLEYMAMFVFVPKVKDQEYLNIAKKYLQINITRRREFLDTYPDYLNDAKKLFGILPEYVLSFMIHMLAHDPHWNTLNSDESLMHIKQCLWFVMEPILKLNENYSFIRKLLEKIKHAQDAADPSNAEMNEKLYICSDIALGLLITKQSSYDLKEYPVELKLPRTRYVSAPNTFFNPDFANILFDDNTRARIQFSPTSKSKQMIKGCMPLILIKGNHSTSDFNKDEHMFEDQDIVFEHNQIIKPSVSKVKKHIAKIVVGFPEMESEYVTEHPSKLTKKVNVRKHRMSRSKSPLSNIDVEVVNQTSVTKRGRICKPNILVMKDMVSPNKKIIQNISKSKGVEDIAGPTVRIEGTVSVNLERLMSEVISQTLTSVEANKENHVLQHKTVKVSKISKKIRKEDRGVQSSSKQLSCASPRGTASTSSKMIKKRLKSFEIKSNEDGLNSLKKSGRSARSNRRGSLIKKNVSKQSLEVRERITRNSVQRLSSQEDLTIEGSDLASTSQEKGLVTSGKMSTPRQRRGVVSLTKEDTISKESISPELETPLHKEVHKKSPKDRITRTTPSRLDLLVSTGKSSLSNDSPKTTSLSPSASKDKQMLLLSSQEELTPMDSSTVSNVCTTTLSPRRLTRSSPQKSDKILEVIDTFKEVSLSLKQPAIRNVEKQTLKATENKSPIELIVRSKRLASHAATEQLAKIRKL